jgi:hypothetical protein
LSKTVLGKEFERECAALAGVCSLCTGTGKYGKDRCPVCKGRGKYGRRNYKSGGAGTVTGIPELTGDAIWFLPYLSKPIVIEAKHGYGDKNKKVKSIRIQKEWFDKHLETSKNMELYPAFAMKFKFTSANGMSKFILIPFPTMEKILKDMENLYLEVHELKNEQKKIGNRRS